MPIFEAQINGKLYDVQGPDFDSVAAALRAYTAGSGDEGGGVPPKADPSQVKGPHWPTTSPWYTTPGSPENGQPIPQGDNLGLKGAGERLVEPVNRAAVGFAQLMDLGASYLPGGNRQAYDELTKHEDARRAAYEQRQGPGSGTQADIAAALLPTGAAAGAASRTENYFGALLRNMTKGGAISAAQYVPEGGSRGQNVAAGAALAGVAHAVGAAVPAARNVVSRLVTKAENLTPRVVETRAAAAPFFDGSEAVKNPAPYSVGQASGSPGLDRLEKQAYGSYQQELRATQYDQAAARVNEIADTATKLAKVPASSEGVASAISTTLGNEVRSLRATRNAAFTAGMNDVAALAGPGGGPGLIRLDNLKGAYQDVLAQDSNAFNLNGSTLPAGVKSALDALQKMPPGAKIKLPTVQYILQGLGQDAPHGVGPFLDPASARLEMYRKQLYAALGQDVDAAGISPTSNPAYAKLQQVRKDYAVNSDKLRTVENGVLNRIFGDPKNLATPQAAMDTYTALRSADKVAAVDILSRRSPDLLQAMRANRITTAIRDATLPGAAKNSAFSVTAFNKSMFGGDKAFDPLWGNDETSKSIKAGAAHLRILLNSTEGGPGSLVTPGDIAINAVSRTPAFAARIATRIAYGKWGDKLLGTPEGLAALRTLANTSSRTRAAVAQASAYMIGLAQTPRDGTVGDQSGQ